MNTMFTSDTHFGHANIIEYCGRPFDSVWYMNDTMIRNWNEVVGPDDTLIHIGDFAMAPKAVVAELLAKLHGRKILIRGNHDKSIEVMKSLGFAEVYDRLEIDLDGYHLYLSHIPVPVDPGRYKRKYKACFTPDPPKYYDYWLCGHVHERWLRKGKIINVGVDQWGFTPVTLQQLIAAPETPECPIPSTI
jgi:calcineurin-like phosphoesterase family protein